MLHFALVVKSKFLKTKTLVWFWNKYTLFFQYIHVNQEVQ